MRPERPDLKPEKPDLRHESPDLKHKRPNLSLEDGVTNKRTDEQMSPCVIQDFIPFGTAAQKKMIHC